MPVNIRPAAAFLLAAAFIFASSARPLAAADAEFVGILALAAEDEVAKELELSAEVRQKLRQVIDEREEAVSEVVLGTKGLSAAERDAKLKPFVAESERLGLALLTAEQKKKLEQIRIGRRGTSALFDAAIAEQIGLSENQQEQLKDLSARMQAESAPAAERERQLIKAKYERQMIALLDKTQRGMWERLTGAGGDDVVAAAPETPTAPPKETATVPMKEATPPAAEKPLDEEPLSPPAIGPKTKPAAALPGSKENVRLKFNFRFAPWKEVLDWFATQADLSLVMDNPPPGTFNYSDQRSYSPPEAIDLLNGVLLTKGFTLIRRGRMLMLINLEDGIPPTLVPQVRPEELEAKGEYELVNCLFTLTKMAPEDAEAEIRKLLGPQGTLIVLPKSKQVYVTETAGKLRTIQRVIQAVENPVSPKDEKVNVLNLQHVTPAEFLSLARPLLGLPDNINAAPDGSLRMSVDEAGARLLLTGKQERIDRVLEIAKLLDLDAGREEAGGPVEMPQLEVYSITAADPASVLQVMQTLLAGLPDVRLASDPKSGNLIALARPSQHATIKETLNQLQRDGRQVEVIKLKKLDPQAAVLAISKLFGGEEGKEGTGPKIDADPNTMQLLIRGSTAQIEQIRDLLKKMGEYGDSGADPKVERSNVRLLPYAGRSAVSALDQVEQLWPAVRPNRIRMVTPSKRGPSELEQRRAPAEPDVRPRDPKGPPPNEEPTSREKEVRRKAGVRVVYVSQPAAAADDEEPAPAPKTRMKTPAPPVDDETPVEETQPEPKKSKPGADIIITQGPNGLAIASDDLDALDDFEALLRSVAESTAKSGREFTVFYLKYAKADAAADLIREAMGSAPAGDAAGGGGGLIGDLASSVLGDSGGLLGGLLGIGGGGGGGGASSGAAATGVVIIPDLRLNALLVNASAKDLDMMEQLLKVVDQPSSPEDVQTVARPKIIPVINTKADEVAAVLRQIYSGRIAADASQPRQPSPDEFLRALRGGRGGGQQQQKKTEEQKVTIGVDTRTNSIVVSAPEYLFEEIRELVMRLDTAVTTADETVKVVKLKRANADVLQRTVSAVLGEQVKTSTPASGAARGGPPMQGRPQAGGSGLPGGNAGRGTRGGQAQQGDPQAQQLRQQLDFFNQLQRLQGGGGGGGGGGGFPGGGGQGGGRGGQRGGGR